MRDLDKYKGIIPAFYGCYDDNGDISPQRVKMLAHFYIEKGVKGLYIGGSSGEAIYHNVEERKVVLENVMEVAGGKLTIIAHVAAPSTRDSIELAKHAQCVGVDAIAAIPGLYYSLSEQMVEKYWNDILTSVNLDMIIYNIPQRTGFNLSLDFLKRMLQNKQVIGVKNSSTQPLDIQQYKAMGGENIIIFNGVDEQFIAGRVMGAEGGIGGTYGVMPELFIELDTLVNAGDLTNATALQYAINEIISDLCSFPCLYASAKAVLKLRGVETGGVRPPFLPIKNGDICQVKMLHEKIMHLIQNLDL